MGRPRAWQAAVGSSSRGQSPARVLELGPIRLAGVMLISSLSMLMETVLRILALSIFRCSLAASRVQRRWRTKASTRDDRPTAPCGMSSMEDCYHQVVAQSQYNVLPHPPCVSGEFARTCCSCRGGLCYLPTDGRPLEASLRLPSCNGEVGQEAVDRRLVRVEAMCSTSSCSSWCQSPSVGCLWLQLSLPFSMAYSRLLGSHGHWDS